MSYPTPPGNPGNGNPYGQPPQYGGWQQPQQPQAPQPQRQYQQQGQWPGYPPQMPPPQLAPSGPQPFGAPAPPSAPRSGSRARGCLSAAGGVFGALLMLGGGALAAHAYSNSRQDSGNSSAYYAGVWRNEPADVLFPDALSGGLIQRVATTDAKRAQWHRLGISQQTSCDKGLTGATRKIVVKQGCKAVLRATYVDPTGNTVATVALIVLSKENGKQALVEYFEKQQDEDHPDGAVHPLAVQGTLAAHWTDAARNGVATDSDGDDSPYLLAVVAGAADGRRAGRLPGTWGAYDRGAPTDLIPWMGAAKNLLTIYGAHLADLPRLDSK